MMLTVFFSGGIADGVFRSFDVEKSPLEFRVARLSDKGTEVPTVDLYRVMNVEASPLQGGRHKSGYYMYQGTRPSAWSLVSFSV